ncbi:hypothetical protein T4D_5126 [Trichinella pseudospiralis]|uniref:Uncharacterized protein n=1 Tax=Trichinella pseudospiralis TaxID=6337 RepID=A0A0V1F255_TRIPS|nr:hypothetical protein T4D_5126 [Trichinella pseudospiralis]
MLFFQKWTKWVLIDSEEKNKHNETVPAFRNCAISTLNQFIPPPLGSLGSNCPNHNNLSI